MNLRATGFAPPSRIMRLSIVIPAYNERATIGPAIAVVAAALPGIAKDIVVVDDGSSDGTRAWLDREIGEGITAGAIRFDGEHLVSHAGADLALRLVKNPRNLGKGAAIRAGLAAANGDVLVIQDADLEYDPEDWGRMYDLIARRGVADVVFGNRFFGAEHRSLYFHHYVGNRIISRLYNVLYNQTLGDIEVCAKMFTRAVRDDLRLTADDFGFEVEFSARIARARRWRIYEVAVRYFGRSYAEGKKIGFRDGLKALWYLIKFRFD